MTLYNLCQLPITSIRNLYDLYQLHIDSEFKSCVKKFEAETTLRKFFKTIYLSAEK